MATWNIRTITKWDSLNGHYWKDRMPHIVGLIQTYDFDILSLQEVSKKQLNVLKNELKDYSFISAGRDDGNLRGEAVGILYKSEKFKMLEKGHFWLSETPDIPSVGWDGADRKICVWAKFLEKSSQVEFKVFSVHLSSKGDNAQKNGVQQIVEAAVANDVPVFIFGDFNAVKESPLYEKMFAAGFSEASQLAQNKYVPSGSYNRYTFGQKVEDVLDLIFISKYASVEYYGILNNFYWHEGSPKHISDHYPVMIRLETEK